MIKQPPRGFAENFMPYIILSVAPLCWAGNIVLARGVAEIIPAFASLLSVWLLDESIHLFHVGGMGFIAGGMALFYCAKA